MYNVNVKNTYGVGGQAIALSQYGSRVGIYACGLYGYQDTLLVNDGTQVYLQGYIEVNRLPFLVCTYLATSDYRVLPTSSSVRVDSRTLVGTQSGSKVQDG